jgi:hypothetical protein
LIDLVGWLVGWEKDEIDQNNRTIIHSFIHSVEQSNKQTNKQTNKRNEKTKEKKETIQSNSPKREKLIENNRSEQKRKETKEKLGIIKR